MTPVGRTAARADPCRHAGSPATRAASRARSWAPRRLWRRAPWRSPGRLSKRTGLSARAQNIRSCGAMTITPTRQHPRHIRGSCALAADKPQSLCV